MDEDRGETGTFTDKLERFKRQGCNLLIVNDVGSEPVACRRLLGDPQEHRRHLFIPTTTTLPSVLDRHDPLPRNSTILGIIDATQAERTRSTVSACSPQTVDTSADWYDTLDELDDLGQLGCIVHDHLVRFASADTPSPGEIRVCMESLDPFLDCVDIGDLFQFLHLLTSRIEQFQGIGHFHLAAGTSQEIISVLEPMFDATVQVRVSADGAVKQQWTLQESGLQSDWLQMKSHENQPSASE